MATVEVHDTSTEWFYVPVRCVHPVAGPVDLLAAGAAPEVAVVARDAEPAEGDWRPAEFDPAGAARGGYYLARLVIGPGHLALEPGRWDVWLRVSLPPERPVLGPIGRILVH